MEDIERAERRHDRDSGRRRSRRCAGRPRPSRARRPPRASGRARRTSQSIIASSALRAASVVSMSAFEPSGRIGRPVVTKCRRPPFQTGSTDSNAGVCGRKPSFAAGQHVERDRDPPVHLDRRAADLAVALREVHVAEREQRARDVDGQEDRRARARLRARRGCRRSRAAGSCAAPSTRRARRPARRRRGLGRQRDAARLGERRLARAEPLQALVRRRDADHADERVGRDADALQPARRRDPSCSPQVTRYGSSKRSPSSPKPGMMAVEPKSSVSTARISTLRTSPGSAPRTAIGPVSGWPRSQVERPRDRRRPWRA